MPSNADLEKRIDELTTKIESSTTHNSPIEEKVWEATLIGSMHALFSRAIPIDSDPTKLRMYLQNALKVADQAAATARNHKTYLEQSMAKAEHDATHDPLKSLLNKPDSDLDKRLGTQKNDTFKAFEEHADKRYKYDGDPDPKSTKAKLEALQKDTSDEE